MGILLIARGKKELGMARTKSTVTEYRNYYLPMNFPVLLLSGDYWKISDVPAGRLHFHNCLEIGVCHTDGGFIEIFGKAVPFKAGDVTVIPKYVPHTTYSNPGSESLWSYIFVDPQDLFQNMLPATWKNFDLSEYVFSDYQTIFSRELYPYIHQLATSVIRELEQQKTSYQLSAKGLLLSLYIEIIRLQSERKDGRMSSVPPLENEKEKQETNNTLVIAPALDYIEEHYMQQFTIEHLADLCHWSLTHFRRVFHEIMGTSPLDYVNNTRIAKACNLLCSTEDSVLNISETVGFHSISSFNRYFIKIMQMTPREYRRQIQKSDHRGENQSIQKYAGWLYPEKYQKEKQL